MPSVKNMLAAAGGAGGAGPNVEEVFSTYLYTGNNTTNNIVNGIDFSTEGGMLWIKNRNDGGGPHTVYDTNRGNNSGLRTNASDDAETGTNNTQDLTAFNSNGFSLGTGWAENVNYNNQEYCSWSFRKAPKFFDVVTYTGDGTSGRSISHNLGCDVGMIIIKNLSRSSDWHTWHRGFTSTSYGAALNQTYAEFTNGGILTATPTSTTVTIKNPGYDGAGTNNSGDSYVMYLFAHNNGDGEFGSSADQDIIKCGSYTGDGGAGTTEVNLGFEPQWILVKATSAADNWFLIDNMRGWVTHNNQSNDVYLMPNTPNAESTGGFLDITSTGFKTTLYTNVNVSSRKYIYIAIRRGPMAVPTSASDVFATDFAREAADNKKPEYRSGFPVDTRLTLYRNGGSSSYPAIGSRLTGNKYLVTATTAAENTWSGQDFDFMNGFMDTAASSINTTLLSYMWRRAPNYFDVVTYQSNNTFGQRIKHNLGAIPEMIWVKNRSSAYDWAVFHKDLNGGTNAEDYYLLLNGSSAEANDTNVFGGYNSYYPTAVDFEVGRDHKTARGSAHYVAYLFATLAGVSKVGSYTGNGGSGTTGNTQNIDCGFSNGAKIVLIKPRNANDSWLVFDADRGISSGGSDPYLTLNDASGEVGGDNINPYSAGFTVVQHGNASTNLTGREYIFYAIAA